MMLQGSNSGLRAGFGLLKKRPLPIIHRDYHIGSYRDAWRVSVGEGVMEPSQPSAQAALVMKAYRAAAKHALESVCTTGHL